MNANLCSLFWEGFIVNSFSHPSATSLLIQLQPDAADEEDGAGLSIRRSLLQLKARGAQHPVALLGTFSQRAVLREPP
ncbi:hypothetical protein, partial [Klebsiella pneumoniae]|uniref:hypothetical protein n=1 Tax=Klebsiella pneumoniae TaxID=573 RepID=UPI000E11842E